MKKKIMYLTLGCIVTVVALACIQGYFIYNTYLLRAKEANSAITQQLLKIETEGKLDTINSAWMRKTGRFIDRYKKNEAAKEDYKKLIAKTEDSLSDVMSKYLTKKGFFEGYEVSYTNYVESVVIYKSGSKEPDTLFTGKMKLFGNNTKNSAETQASQSRWRGNTNETSAQPSEVNFDFDVVTIRFYSIDNWQQKVLMKMAGMLIFSVLLLVFVVLLFYLSIKSLIRQRKIADIKTDFINNITHEFQTPLAALDIAVKTLQRKDGELSPEQYATSLNIIGRQNQRMQKLFRQVTQASLSPVIDDESVQLLGYEDVTEIVNDFRLSHPDIIIHCTQGSSFSIKMDRFHLNTVLVNLLDNAVKYGAGQVEVHMETEGSKSKITVKDNGPGIPQKEQAAIFEKFYRIEKGNIHTTKGLGLGLFYIRRIIDAYKGSINIVSSEGQGAEFIITIPLS